MDQLKKTSPRIIVIDDNPAIHDDFRKILAAEKSASSIDNLLTEMIGTDNKNSPSINVEDFPIYRIDSAYQGQEGFTMIREAFESQDPYALAFVDIRMPPGWDGIETIKNIYSVDPNIQTVICSAYSDYSWPETIKQLGQTDRLLILKKPFDNIEIRQIACALSKKWQLNAQLNYHLNNLEKLLDEHTATLKATFESTLDGILVINKERQVMTYNQNFIDMWHIPSTLIKSTDIYPLASYILTHIKNKDHFENYLQKLYDTPSMDGFLVIETTDQKIFEFYSKPEFIQDKINGRIFSFRDITERKRMEEELSHQATHDLLTGLPNRLLLQDRIQQAIASAKRFEQLVGIIFFDLDRFKQINDSLGHTIGDKLLQELGKKLQANIREIDTLARLGGDEFVAVISSLEEEEEILPIVQKLLEELEKPLMIGEHELLITASAGIAIYPKSGQNTEDLLKNADTAMYRAKELGRNNFQFYTQEMNVRAIRRIELESHLRHALNNNEFKLYYQPFVSLETGDIIGAEALLKWLQPKLGIVSPTEFIPLVEESGLIFPISDWVIETACKQQKAWQDAKLPPIRMRISINLSAHDIKQRSIVARISKIIEETKCDPRCFELELTEGIVMEGSEYIVNTLVELKKLGVTLAIDDFGMGYSNLSYLSHFPIDRIKIDREFIKAMHSDKTDVAIVLTIINLAKNLNLSVLAEGVEREDEVQFLKKNGCDEMQGFYFSPPVPAEEFEAMVRQKKNLNDVKH